MYITCHAACNVLTYCVKPITDGSTYCRESAIKHGMWSYWSFCVKMCIMWAMLILGTVTYTIEHKRYDKEEGVKFSRLNNETQCSYSLQEIVTTSWVPKRIHISTAIYETEHPEVVPLFALPYACCGLALVVRVDISHRPVLLRKPQLIQWNLSVTTTSIIKLVTCDLFSNVF